MIYDPASYPPLGLSLELILELGPWTGDVELAVSKTVDTAAVVVLLVLVLALPMEPIALPNSG